ncbi:hypothetical protein [Halarcobacter anaerophilus]|jgi:hypothetical protein|uniref:hypothetical protein n=1 Tax=Halarcobacter anaerophilus TaxID=877500 RepID=UPI0005C99CFC|nr:hypothetical protein [Halarcobacter anaerophilus]
MKKSFTLFSTLILILLFSLLAVKIFETKNITSINILKQYNYIQAKNHLEFLEEYIKSLESLEMINKIQIKNDNFEILALIKKEDDKFTAFLNVKALNYKVRVFKKIEL